MVQALIFGLVGYGIAVFFIQGFRSGIARSGILFNYSPEIKIGFFVITILIAQAGAAFAMRRIAKIEPASVFRT
jgi:putative ABC transport system permease protein